MVDKFMSSCGCRALLASVVLICVAALQAGVSYTCPMDPDVSSAVPGKCPRCGMALRTAQPGAARWTPPSKNLEGPVAALQVPDTTVVDQNGRKLRFYTDLVKDRTVAINFIFTTCTTICPTLTATFRKVQQELGGRVGKDTALISVSVDPATDTPERLKAFAAKFRAEAGWTFVTGSAGDIDRLLEALGAATPDKLNHTPMLLVGNDKAHYWTRAYGLAPAAKLVSVITEAAQKPPAHTSDAHSHSR